MPLYITTVSGETYEVAEEKGVGDILELFAAAREARGDVWVNVCARETRYGKHQTLQGVVLIHRIEGVFNA